MKAVLFLVVTLVGIALWLASVIVPHDSCTTEEIARVVSPDRALTATYENAICSSSPDLLQARILIMQGVSYSKISWQTVFNASTAIDKSLSRPTQAEKLKLRWLDASTLGVDTSQDLAGSAGESVSAQSKVKLVINGHKLPDQENSSSRSGLDILKGLLGSPDQRVVTNDAFIVIYDNFGKDEYWPIVSALWIGSKAEYPNFNWVALDTPVARLKIAGLWGQWSREVKKDMAAPGIAAAFARQLLTAEIPAVRLDAISTLGSVGSSKDIDALFVIATESDEQAAIRATSAIFAIERISKTSNSVLPRIEERAKHDQVRAKAVQLRNIGIDK